MTSKNRLKVDIYKYKESAFKRCWSVAELKFPKDYVHVFSAELSGNINPDKFEELSLSNFEHSLVFNDINLPNDALVFRPGDLVVMPDHDLIYRIMATGFVRYKRPGPKGKKKESSGSVKNLPKFSEKYGSKSS